MMNIKSLFVEWSLLEWYMILGATVLSGSVQWTGWPQPGPNWQLMADQPERHPCGSFRVPLLLWHSFSKNLVPTPYSAWSTFFHWGLSCNQVKSFRCAILLFWNPELQFMKSCSIVCDGRRLRNWNCRGVVDTRKPDFCTSTNFIGIWNLLWSFCIIGSIRLIWPTWLLCGKGDGGVDSGYQQAPGCFQHHRNWRNHATSDRSGGNTGQSKLKWCYAFFPSEFCLKEGIVFTFHIFPHSCYFVQIPVMLAVQPQ